MTEELVYTADEVAGFLRVSRADVDRLLERGQLQGLKVAGEWRVLAVAIEDFLCREMKAEQQRAQARVLLDPREWIRVMPSDLRASLQETEYEEGTAGRWLQDAIRADDQERAAENVVPLDADFSRRRPRVPSASDPSAPSSR